MAAGRRRQRIRRNKISGKFNNKHFQKGRGAPLEGRHTGRGGFVWMPERDIWWAYPALLAFMAILVAGMGFVMFSVNSLTQAGAMDLAEGRSLSLEQ